MKPALQGQGIRALSGRREGSGSLMFSPRGAPLKVAYDPKRTARCLHLPASPHCLEGVGELAQTAIEFPPMQQGASFNLQAVKEQVEAAIKHPAN